MSTTIEDPAQLGWQDDALQGIIDGPNLAHPDLTEASGLTFGESLLDLPDLSLDASQQPFLNNPWSPEPHDLYFSHYTTARLGNQDAWNPLQVTGVPATAASHMHLPGAVGDPHCHFSKTHYRTPSECGSQYMGSFHSSDSGYGGSAGCATQSVVTSSYGLDVTSPQTGSHDHVYADSALFDQTATTYGPESTFSVDVDESPSQVHEDSIKCDHPSCSWVGKCPSDKKKHEARHRKLFKCDEPNCLRKEGFGTINDLARHKKCVHHKDPERGPKMLYICFGRKCPRPDKKWPRLDNFKQHISRMHGEEDLGALLKKSMDWYENSRAGQSFCETSSQDESMLQTQRDLVSASPATGFQQEFQQDRVDFFPSRPVKAKQTKNYAQSVQNPADPELDQQSALSSLGLASSLNRDCRDMSAEPGNAPEQTFFSGAADNLIHAMTKMVNTRGRRLSQQTDEGVDLGPESRQLSQPQRQILQKVLSAALERLSDDVPSVNDTDTEKQDWFQCDACPKRTRRRCEMKKHQKRHERPYTCTFPHCNKSFGSKADWKRHESSQHLHIPSWLCTIHDGRNGTSCVRLFYRQDSYVQHLSQYHRVHDDGIRSSVYSNRLDPAGSQFWCGFCRHVVPLRNHGPAAWDERFNHIDLQHFRKGEKGHDWCLPSSVFRNSSDLCMDSVDAMDVTPDGVVDSAACTDDGSHTSGINRRKRKFMAS